MFKRLCLLLGFCVVLMSSSAADAKEMAGKFGLGGEATLGGIAGIQATYWATPLIQLNFALNFDLYAPNGNSPATIDFGLAAGAIFNFIRYEKTNFGIGARINFSASKPGNNDTITQFSIDVPLRVEHFFSEHFSIHLAAGLVFDLVSNRRVDTVFGTITTNGGFALTTSLLGMAGFTFYF